MPAITSIAINDGESTPISHVLAPVTTNGALARYANRAGTTPAGFETLVAEVLAPRTRDGAHTVRFGFGDPVEVAVNGITAVDHVNSFELKFNFSQKSTKQERKNLRTLAANLLLHSEVVKIVDDIEPAY